MWRPAIASVLAVAAAGQTAPNAFNKAPKNVEDALKTRVDEFYQDHVDGKYRKAEALVAEESKDGFYAANKPALESFRLGDIAYSDHYRKAKVTVVGKMTMMFLGMGAPQKMDVPFPSYWKLEGGKWVWYINNDPNRMTPFGRANGKSTEAGGAADPTQAFLTAPNVAAIQSGVKADKTEVQLSKTAGSKGTVMLLNQLPGLVSLSLGATEYPGLAVKLDPKELKAGGTSTLSIEAAGDAKDFVNRVVRVLVQPSNQAIDVAIKFQ